MYINYSNTNSLQYTHRVSIFFQHSSLQENEQLTSIILFYKTLFSNVILLRLLIIEIFTITDLYTHFPSQEKVNTKNKLALLATICIGII